MSSGTVVLLPPAVPSEDDGFDAPLVDNRRELAAELMAYGINVYLVPQAPEPGETLDARTATAHWVAHNAVTLTAERPNKPILLVATGSAGAMMPAVGFSQKASRRPVSGYVVIDGVLPKAGAADWPDAPVTYVRTTADPAAMAAAREAGLRGWTVETVSSPATAIREIAVQL
ncbi:MAG: hypothetical protein HQ526_00275 [Actinobacteria bacterium]|nr:hypothetical protein [Actinomycetota bacterium]